jgi:glycosyltransferase involved in cell wall biosynthesis
MVLNWKRRLPFYFCKWVSSTVPLLISNSKAGLEDHQKEGFRARREVVIPNGIDTETFRPDLEAGAQLRARWSVKESEILIGLVGRLVEMKGHKIFLRAAARLTRTQAGVRFVCVGDGPAAYRRYLQSFGEKLGLGDKIIWAGELREMRAVYNAFDIFTLPSVYGEGFPNVVGEAMACGVPCVVTDVGDSAWLVGKTGVVVPPANPAALLDGWQILLREGPIDSSKLRSRIIDNFSLKTLVEETEKALLEELEHQ